MLVNLMRNIRDVLSEIEKHLNIFKYWKDFYVEDIFRIVPGDRHGVNGWK